MENQDSVVEQRSNHWTSITARPWSLKSWTPSSLGGPDAMPPPYSRHDVWAREHPVEETIENEKLAALRRNKHITKRGGWRRLLFVLVCAFIIIVALAIGLGVGLSRKHKAVDASSSSDASDTAGQTTPQLAPVLSFPLGEYSIITALSSVQTNCTSNPSTWRCYPYSTFDASSPSNSMATFNWVISNTSSVYFTNDTLTATDSLSEPTNLTVSSTANPFSITFSGLPLVYINNNSNPRFVFSFTGSKNTIPTTALTSTNTASECFFNQTSFTGTLYLSSSVNNPVKDYPSGALASSTGVGGYTPWPYAVQIQQTSPGGQDVPACYETINGNVGARIEDALEPQSVEDMCLCDYKNYGF